jgi:hypothetical protein
VIDFLFRDEAGWHILAVDSGHALQDDPWRGRRPGRSLNRRERGQSQSRSTTSPPASPSAPIPNGSPCSRWRNKSVKRLSGPMRIDRDRNHLPEAVTIRRYRCSSPAVGRGGGWHVA